MSGRQLLPLTVEWQTLKSLDLGEKTAGRLGLPDGTLQLRRAWPRAANHLALEYVATDGRLVAGQWFGSPADLHRVARETIETCPGQADDVVVMARLGVMLQAHGADRRLPGLAPLLRENGADLLLHRPERRAVLRLNGRPGQPYAKVVHPKHVQRLAGTAQRLQGFGDDILVVPELVEVNPAAGVLIWSPVPGSSVHDLLKTHPDDLFMAAPAIGRALRTFHESRPRVADRRHTFADEITVLHSWIERVGTIDPHLATELDRLLPAVGTLLAAGSSSPVLIHRDLHDKQVLIGRDGIGLIDLDTLTIGEGALDLANLLVHLELRALQGWHSPDRAVALAAAIVEGYRPDQRCLERLAAYADATRLRLACVYSFRPAHQAVVVPLLNHLGVPLFPYG